MTGESYDFTRLRDELDKGIQELEGRLQGTNFFGDDATTLAYRQHITFMNICRGFADSLAKQGKRHWHTEHGIAVLRLDDRSSG